MLIRYQNHNVSPFIKKILIIDDETDLCSLLKRVLTHDNFTVDCAYSLSEADNKMQEHPHIVLLDNNLPDGTGLEYLQMHPVQFMGTIVIMISADASPSLERKAMQEGVYIFINKPFSVRGIREVIRQTA
jgi:DNA-binding NtrC family response regulator